MAAVNIHILPSATDLYQSAALDFIERANAATQDKHFFHVAFSGGDSAKLFFDKIVELGQGKIPWKNIKVFFVDERFLPINDPQSNYHNAELHLFSKINIPPQNIYRMKTEYKSPADAALAYEKILHQEISDFDVIYLGLGPNAHTASLMPNTDLVTRYVNDPASMKQWVAGTDDPVTHIDRITLTPTVINNSKSIIFLVSGKNKASAVHEILAGDFLPKQYPAQLIQGKIIWYLDQDAASRI
jgi:6-phosphogluconolactonase